MTRDDLIAAMAAASEEVRARMDAERDRVPRGKREPWIKSYLPRQRTEMARAALEAVESAGFAIVPKVPSEEGQSYIVRAVDEMRAAGYRRTDCATISADLIVALASAKVSP